MNILSPGKNQLYTTPTSYYLPRCPVTCIQYLCHMCTGYTTHIPPVLELMVLIELELMVLMELELELMVLMELELIELELMELELIQLELMVLMELELIELELMVLMELELVEICCDVLVLIEFVLMEICCDVIELPESLQVYSPISWAVSGSILNTDTGEVVPEKPDWKLMSTLSLLNTWVSALYQPNCSSGRR